MTSSAATTPFVWSVTPKSNAAHGTMKKPYDIETVRALAAKHRNWGRWGADDELGTLNFITPAKILEAAGLVRAGKVISLAIPFDAAGPQSGFAGRINPIHYMLQDGD